MNLDDLACTSSCWPLRRLRGDPPGLTAAAHAAHVADQRARRHRGGWRDPHGRREQDHLRNVLGTIAIVAATSNIVGGFLITDRMLKMFKSSGPEK